MDRRFRERRVREMDEKEANEFARDKRIEEYMERTLWEIRWIRNNMNPPVNYFFVTVVSIVTSIITTLILTH